MWRTLSIRPRDASGGHKLGIMLFVTATPIGNLSDASERLRTVLGDAELIAAEDTRKLRQLASGIGVKIKAKVISLNDSNEREQVESIAHQAKTMNVVLVSDAGMPTISDPGYNLVKQCHQQGVEVISIAGPSAVVSALSVSGLATDRFCFEGFIPKKHAEKTKFFENLVDQPRTMVFFETAPRMVDSLEVAAEVLGDREASVSRELTKMFEETITGKLSEIAEEIAQNPRGEMVLVIAGNQANEVDYEELVTKVIQLVDAGMGLKQAAQEVSENFGGSKRELYQRALAEKK